MKRKPLLIILLLALMVPLATFAQVERTATVYNGTDKECHVPVYGNLNDGDRSLSQFIMDKSVLQTVGLTGKQITKMTFYLANPVPASYQWTTPRTTEVTLAEVDASELDADGNVIQSEDMTDEQIVARLYLDAQGETMEIAFSTPYTYSGEKNLLVQFEEQYRFCPNGYTPFGPYRKPVFYGVYKDGASGWNKVTYTGGHPTRLNKYNFVPKTTFTYLADEANFFNTKVPQNARATTWCDESNGNYSYKIQLQWDAPANYTGNYQVLCVPRGTSTLDWSNPIATSNTFYTFEGLQKNTSYDLYVRAKLGYVYTSAAATASATTPFYPANLDEGDLVFDFNSRTMPNGLTLAGNATYLVRPYSDHTYSLNRLGYYNVGAEVGSFDWMGRQHYLETTPLTITLPELKFTNASNGLMVDFDLIKEEVYYDAGPAQVLVKLHDDNYSEDLFSATASTDESYYNGQHFTYRITNVDQSSSQHIYKLSFSSVDGGKGFTIDNIVVRKAPAIIPAYNLAASEITPNSATISWTDENTNSHTFDLVYRQKGYSNDPNEWQHYVEGVSNPHTLTGLTPYTDYEVKVKTITSSAYEDSEILGFSTQCTPASVPYNESFAGLTTLPTDWRVNVPEYAEVVTEVGNGRLTLHNTATEVTQNIYGYTSTYTSYSQFGAYIILPYFNNLGSLQLSFKAGRTQGTMESLSVGVVADPNNYTDYTEIGTATLTDNANGEVYSYNLVNNAVQSGHIVIYFGKYESNLQSIWLDDFNVQQYAAPTGLTVSNVTNTTATLGWNAGAATEWEVRYGTDANNYGTPVTVTEPTYTITGLTASTNYVAQVRAKYGDNLYSEWVSFPNFTTYYSAPVSVDKDHTYSFGFQRLILGTVMSSDGGWQLINKSLFGNDWMISDAPGTLTGESSGTNYSLHISYNGSAYQYLHRGEDNLGNDQSYGSTVYATRVFTLAPGSYQFSYRWKCKGIHDSDYFRVALVPANTVLTASNSAPDGLSYNSLPTGWIALDGGEALNPMSTNYGFDTYSTPENARIPILEGGNYMMVFVWHNISNKLTAVVNPPVAIDNVGISCTSLIDPPVSIIVVEESDTEATLSWTAPTTGFAPTGYEVQYTLLSDEQFADALTVATNTNSITLTGLTANTNYRVRVRSVYTASGNTIYSDWTDAVAISTKYPSPTNLTVVSQTSSWANVMWTEGMELPEGQSFQYKWQLTTDTDNWGLENSGLANNSWTRVLAPDTYHLRVKIDCIYDSNSHETTPVDNTDWSEPIEFTIAPWSAPVTIFPLSYDFETGNFVDGLTLQGYTSSSYSYEQVDKLFFYEPYYDGVAAHSGDYVLRFNNNGPATRPYSLVLPPLRPTASHARVSFYWYHGTSNTDKNDGVYVETSTDGTNWETQDGIIKRYVAGKSGWTQYDRVFETPANYDKVYVRLRFVGDDVPYNPINNCLLDDLTVTTFKSYQPYISYVGCDAYTATITLYDYAYQNGWPSSAFHVQYRKVGQNTWIDYADFVNQAPYAFENSLTINGLDPNSYYEFHACARVSYNGNDLSWSTYCEPYSQWTDNGVFTVTPTHPYEHDFEFGAYNWTEGSWNTRYEGGYDGSSYCAHATADNSSVLISPVIAFSSDCNNAIIRFYKKEAVRVRVYYGPDFESSVVLSTYSSGSSWVQIELSLSKYMSQAPIKIAFENVNSNGVAESYVDDIEIIANAYDKVCDGNPGASWSNASIWYPQGVPTANDNVAVMSMVYVGPAGASPCEATAKEIWTGNSGYVYVYSQSSLVAEKLHPKNTSSFTFYDGAQLKAENPSSGRFIKTIVGYTNQNGNDHYYLFAPPFSWSNNSSFTSGDYDLYHFDGSAELEWINHKNPVNNAMQRGKGYLYAHAKPSNGDTHSLVMNGELLPVSPDQTISGLTYGSNTETNPFLNWNLVGNPFPCNAYLVRDGEAVPFYKMNETGDAIVPARAGTAIKPMEGVFVIAETEAESSVTFTTTEPALDDEPEAIMPSIPIHALTEHQDALLLAAQTIALVQGWNWFAPMARITAAQLRSALDGYIVQLRSKEGEVDTNAVLEPGRMFKIQVNAAPENVSVSGVYTAANISIENGSNWFGYTSETGDIATALDALGIIPVDGDKIISQDGGFAIFNGSTWEGTLTLLTQGEGYVYVR